MTEKKYTRKVRNFLIDKRFQLKYTLSVMLISTVISGALGTFLYQAHQEIYQAQQEIYNAHRENSKMISLDPDLDEALAKELRTKDEQIRKKNLEVQSQTRNVLLYLAVFLGMLVLCVGAVSIVATHKIAGPAYALRRMVSDLANGKLNVYCGLRKGDELQSLAEQLRRLVDQLKEREKQDIEKFKHLLVALEDPSFDPKRDSPKLAAVVSALIQEREERLTPPPQPPTGNMGEKT